MMELLSLSPVSPLILIAIGILLIAIEAIAYSFILLWFGLAFVIVGISSNFITFHDGLWQIISISIIAIVLLLTLRARALRKFMKPVGEAHNDDFFNEEGDGIIKDGKVYFKATYWKIDAKSNDFTENEKVKVLSTHKGSAKIERY